jgi:hypothetical protein
MTPILGVTASQISGHLITSPYWLSYKRDSNIALNSESMTEGGIYLDSSNNIYQALLINGNSCLTKYNSSGIEQFSITTDSSIINGSRSSIASDSSENFYLIGGGGSTTLVLSKFNNSGTLQWVKELYTNINYGDVISYNICTDSSSNIYVVGYFPNASFGPNGFIVKYDTSGVLQWQKEIIDQNSSLSLQDTEIKAVETDSAGNVYVTGSYSKIGGTVVNAFTAKFNSAGTIQWQRFLEDSVNAFTFTSGNAIALDSSSNVYITGYDNSSNAFIAKYNTSGTLQWQRFIKNSGGYAGGYGICVDSSSNVYAIISESTPAYVIAKYNTSGTIQWQRSLQATSLVAYHIKHDSLSNLYVGGNFTNSSGGINAILIKIPDDGTLTQNITLPIGNISYSNISVTESAGTLISGTSALTSGNGSFVESTVNTIQTSTTATSIKVVI